MEFCELCENMLYKKNDEDNNFIYYCKNCDNKIIKKKENGSICVIDDNKIDDIIKYSQYNTEYIEHDHTLPRVNNIHCTNINCTKKKDEENEIIYMKYDKDNMRYLYYCVYCHSRWKSN